MKRPPLLATLVVLFAVAAMIGLGIWQLQRAQWKMALLARYAQAQQLPPVAFPISTGDEALLFRRSSAMCLNAVGWSVVPGRRRDGTPGWRHLAACRTGAEGPGVTIDIGWTPDFAAKPRWRGGLVTGVIAAKPDHRSLIAILFGARREPGVLLIADAPAPGLQPSAFPALADVPNNHLAYAVQWFIFAAIALVIYLLALRRRGGVEGA